MRVKRDDGGKSHDQHRGDEPPGVPVNHAAHDVVDYDVQHARTSRRSPRAAATPQSAARSHEREAEKRHRRGNRDADFVLGRVRIARLFHAEPRIGDVRTMASYPRLFRSTFDVRVRSVMPLSMKNAPVASTELTR